MSLVAAQADALRQEAERRGVPIGEDTTRFSSENIPQGTVSIEGKICDSSTGEPIEQPQPFA